MILLLFQIKIFGAKKRKSTLGQTCPSGRLGRMPLLLLILLLLLALPPRKRARARRRRRKRKSLKPILILCKITYKFLGYCFDCFCFRFCLDFSASAFGHLVLVLFQLLGCVLKSPVVVQILLLSIFPSVVASSGSSPFPKILFIDFSKFVSSNFGPSISLATALVLFFTITDNPELINLHARQQNPELSNENEVKLTGWIKSLSRSLLDHLGTQKESLFTSEDTVSTDLQQVIALSKKLDKFAKILPFPYKKKKVQGISKANFL